MSSFQIRSFYLCTHTDIYNVHIFVEVSNTVILYKVTGYWSTLKGFLVCPSGELCTSENPFRKLGLISVDCYESVFSNSENVNERLRLTERQQQQCHSEVHSPAAGHTDPHGVFMQCFWYFSAANQNAQKTHPDVREIAGDSAGSEGASWSSNRPMNRSVAGEVSARSSA